MIISSHSVIIMEAIWSMVSAVASTVQAFLAAIALLWRRDRRQVTAEADQDGLVARISEAEPVVVGDIPHEAPCFQPRAGLMEALDAVSSDREHAPDVRALTGMRGVGKTQLAAAYARARLADRWRLVAWINAGNAAALRGGLADVAARLGLDGGTGDVAEAGRAVRRWLETGGDRCLLVFDNAADPEDLLSFIPAVGHARVLITSNEELVADLGARLMVDVFTMDEALEFLASRTGSADTDDAHVLATELGYLPLALAQAAAMIAVARLDYRTYLQRLRAGPVDSLLPRARGSAYPAGLAATVLLSLDAVQAEDGTGLCSAVMELLSVLSATGVSRALLYSAGKAALLAGRDQAAGAAPEAIDGALGQLAGCSLLTFRGDRGTVTAHRLVMRVIRERLASRGRLAEVCLTAARALEGLIGQQQVTCQDRASRRELVEQIMALCEVVASSPGDAGRPLTKATLKLRLWTVKSLNELGDNADRAIQIADPLPGAMERLWGSDSRHTMAARNNLAIAYQRAGRAAEATPLFERTLSDRKRVLGPDHPDTLNSRDNLAAAYQQAGRAAEAIKLHASALADMERVLRTDGPEVARALLNLGSVQQQLGQLTKARASFERARDIFRKHCGPDSPEVASALVSLGGVQVQLWEPEQARASFERALAITEAAGDPDSAETARALVGLSGVQRRQWQLGEARAGLERALGIFQEVYGSDHPEVASALINLAIVQMRLGELGEARTGLERALTALQLTYDPYHPGLAPALINLGAVQLAMWKRADACASLKRALEISEAAYGPNHPDVASALINLGIVQLQMGELEEPRASFERALRISEVVYGPDHPEVASALINLGGVPRRMWKLEDARVSLERALVISKAAYGPDHPEVAQVLVFLSAVQVRLGALGDARAGCERALEIIRTVYGPDHPMVAFVLINLGCVQLELRDRRNARASYERALTISKTAYGPDHPEVATALVNLGICQLRLRDLKRARVSLQEGLKVSEEAYGPGHPEVASALTGLGLVLMRMRKLKDAQTCLERALTIDERVFGPDHPEVASTLTSLSFVQMRQGKVKDARTSLERARAISNPGVAGRVRALQRVVSVSLALMNATTRRNRRRLRPGRARDDQSRPR